MAAMFNNDNNDVEKISKLSLTKLELGLSLLKINPNMYDESNKVPLLFFIVKNNDNQMVKEKTRLLLKYGLDINISMKDRGENILFKAGVDLLDFFVEEGANLEHQLKRGSFNTPLHERINSLNVLNKLLELGAKLNTYELYKKSKPLPYTLKFLLDKGLLDIHEVSQNNKNILFFANKYIMELIIDKLDVNHKDDYGYTPLMYQQDLKEIEFLLSKGASVNEISKNGINAAFLKKSTAVIQCLVDHGIDLNIKDKDGNNILYYQTNVLNLKYLISQGVNPLEENNEGDNLLKANHLSSTIKLYQSYGVDVNHRNNKGEHVLFKISELDSLLDYKEAGINFDLENNDGDTLFTKNMNILMENFSTGNYSSIESQHILSTTAYIAPYINKFAKNKDELINFKNILEKQAEKTYDYNVDIILNSIKPIYNAIKEQEVLVNILKTTNNTEKKSIKKRM